MSLTSPLIDQAISLKFRLLSIQFTIVRSEDEPNQDFWSGCPIFAFCAKGWLYGPQFSKLKRDDA